MKSLAISKPLILYHLKNSIVKTIRISDIPSCKNIRINDKIVIKEPWTTLCWEYDWESGDCDGWYEISHKTFYTNFKNNLSNYLKPRSSIVYKEEWFDDGFSSKERGFSWRSPVTMPDWASRFTLTITKIRKEKIQDITPEKLIQDGYTVNTALFLKTNRCLMDYVQIGNPESLKTNKFIIVYDFTLDKKAASC